MNDQYVTIHDLRVQVEGVVEGIRILNEHIEEYDQILDSLQTSTQRFFAEVKLENDKRNTVLCQAFDNMYEKITTDVSAKLEFPASPAPGALSSPHTESPRQPLPPPFPNSSVTAPPVPAPVLASIENQAKLYHDLHLRVNGFQTQFFQHRQNTNQNFQQVMAQFGQVYEELNNRSQAYEQGRAELAEKVQTLDYSLTRIGAGLQTHTANSENNFKETAIHMDSVKKRFAEHRAILETMITTWRNLASSLDELEGKYESLKEFLSSKVVPTFAKLRKTLPELFDGAADDGPGSSTSRDGDRSPELTQNNDSPLLLKRDNGDANNPIEL